MYIHLYMCVCVCVCVCVCARTCASLVSQIVKNLPRMQETQVSSLGWVPESGRLPREERGNPLQYSCLENPMDRGAWWATLHGGRKESDMTE